MLKDKVIIVTGGGRGIGRGICIEAAKQGARVVVNDLGGSAEGQGGDRAPADAVVAEIEAAGGQAIADFHSVAEWDSAHEIIKTAVDHFGRLDGIVNNAGILRDRIFHKMTESDFDAVIAVHLKGSFNVARAAAPIFRDQQSGSYVHMTSTSGLIGNFGQANYAAAKLGVVGLSKSIALDMARFNVRSNCISPFAYSRLIGTIPQETEAERARVARIQSMTPETIAPVAVCLLSDAAQGVSGQIFVVRKNEIFLMSQSRPLRAAHASEGWTPQTVADRVLPAMRASFFPLDRSSDVFSWDPI